MDTTSESEHDDTALKKQKVSKFEIQTLFSSSKNSKCWKHFGRLVLLKDGKKKHVLTEQVFCSVCLSSSIQDDPDALFGLVKIKAYSKNVSTGNLTRHLKDEHNIEESEKYTKHAANIKKFFGPSAMARPSTSTNTPSKKKWLLARDLALWFARSLIPFDNINDDAIIDFLKKYNVIFDKEDLPTRTTISRDALDDVYSSMLIEIKRITSSIQAQHVAMTTDLWSDSYRRRHYITFTLHFINDNMQLQNITLETVMMMGKKTGERIKEAIETTRERFGISNKEIFLVTDSGSNVKKAAKLIPDIHSHFCLGHGLHNLVTVDGIGSQTEVKNLIKKSKKIVKSLRFRAPELESEADKEQRQILMSVKDSTELDVGVLDDDTDSEDSMEKEEEWSATSTTAPTLKTETPTRWHSVLAMLESISHPFNRGPVNSLLGKIGKTYLKLDDYEWKVIQDLIKILKKLKKSVEILSAEEYCSINVALVIRSEIADALSSQDDNTSLAVVAMTNKMLEALDHRFPITDLLIVASLLDPRFQNLKTITDFLQAKDMTKVEFLSYYGNSVLKIKESHVSMPASSLAAPTTPKNPSTSTILLDLASKHSSEASRFSLPIETEAWKYCCSIDASDVTSTILEFWYNRKNVFPYLYAMARAVLSIPATSTPSERVFSVAGMVVTAKRSRLSPMRVDKIIFIHDNYKLVGRHER